MAACEWKDQFGGGCRREVAEGTRCVFHMPKSGQTLPALVEEFAAGIQAHIASGQPCDFRGFQFPSDFDFVGVHFRRAALFTDAHFDGVSLRAARFDDRASFEAAVFDGDAEFTFTRFAQAVDFKRARFAMRADFGGDPQPRAMFEGSADFTGAEFESGASFLCTFCQTANFSQARFKGDVFFVADFRGPAVFEWARIEGQLRIGSTLGDSRVFHDRVNFKRVTLRSPGTVAFERVDLRQASFVYTNIDPFEFHDVDWVAGRSRQNGLYDETALPELAREQPPLARVAENYRQLVLNYERKRDFLAAEDFHVGEMETLRKLQKRIINGYAAYRAASNYGTDYWWAAAVLLSLLTAASLGFMTFGFKVGGRLVDYTLLPSSNQRMTWGLSWIRDFAESFSLTLSTIPFRYPGDDVLISLPSRIWATVWSPILAGQIALIALAIRRRFRR